MQARRTTKQVVSAREEDMYDFLDSQVFRV